MAQLPDWQPLDGVVAPIPEGSVGGRIVVLVASEGAASAGWAPVAAMDLVRQWSAQGHRLVLVDGGLESPSLHEAAGIRNREGLSDATLYGASVSLVSRPVGEQGFFLITAGTPVADPDTVVLSPRWSRMSAGMGEAGVTMVLYLRDGAAGTAAFLGSASDIVVLSVPGEAAPGAVSDLEPLVRTVTGFGSVEESVDIPSEPAVEEVAGPGRVSPRESGGSGRLLLFMVLAVVVAAVLGIVLSSGMG